MVNPVITDLRAELDSTEPVAVSLDGPELATALRRVSRAAEPHPDSHLGAGQRVNPVHLQGRVAAATTMALFAPQPLAHLGGAAAIIAVDYRTVFLVASTVGAGNLLLVLSRLRHISSGEPAHT